MRSPVESDIVVDDDHFYSMPSARAISAARPKRADAGVVLDHKQSAGPRRVDRSDYGVSIRRRKTSRDGSTEHAAADVASVRGSTAALWEMIATGVRGRRPRRRES
jgi:hypothetical protein